jgi:hypothetical protein
VASESSSALPSLVCAVERLGTEQLSVLASEGLTGLCA